ncbi:nitroreductase family protein [Mycetocola spongiae]|uniref:nitroreductase family protein n=1 Tax=Mycetocola spongiae TaxID=2859226 RepID=UPI001CF30EA1|nr:nitroreductase family protein [Mycetocola spongiae]UCR88345.1 nitroreductase family protein [Mycetocola spongiae]
MTITDTSRHAQTSAPISQVLAARWSPRAYVPEAIINETTLTAALEAARWSPSANNSQPWRFILARRGTESFQKVVDALVGFNQAWAHRASVLLVAVAEPTDAEGNAQPWAYYDLGQAVAHFSVQAHKDGLFVHQMAGFDGAALSTAFSLEERLVPFTVTAVGELAAPDTLEDGFLRERETAPRERKALADIVIVND